MKKRLLSAALALAMVLTMLPLTAFAATTQADGDGTETVTYVQYNDSKNNYPDAPAWYVTHVTPANGSTPAVTEYIKVEEGISLGGKYYDLANYNAEPTADSNGKYVNKSIYNWNSDYTSKTGLKSGVIVIGGTGIELDAVDATSLTFDVYGGEVTVKGGKLTSVTVNNNQYATYGKNGTVKLDNGVINLTSLTLKHVTFGDSSLELKVKGTNDVGVRHSLTLEDVTTSSTITLNGVGDDLKKTRAAQSLSITKSSVGNITVNGTGSTVTLNEVTAGSASVSIEGTGGSLTVKGGSTLGAVTITGDKTNSTAQTTAPSNVSIETGSTVASINATGVDSGEVAGGRNTVSISGTVTGAVNLKNSAVTVNGGTTGALTVETGTVTVSGNRATVGNVDLKHDATFNLTGTNCKIGELKVNANGTPATVTFNVPNDPSNTLGGATSAVSGGYTKRTIKGGTWTAAVPAANLDASLVYQLRGGTTGPFTYYTSDQLGEAIITQGSTTGSELTKIGVTGTTQTVSFMNGSSKWGELKVAPGTTIPKLPEQMNSVKTPYWSDGEFSNLAGLYNTPGDANTTTVTLNAGGGGAVTGEVTELTDVKIGSNASDIKAVLVNNVITLSGAIGSTDTKFDLTLETDAVDDQGAPVAIEVSVSLDAATKTLTFVHPGSMSLGNGVIIENTFAAIKLSNGTRYTLNGQGLVVRDTTIKVKELDKDTYPTATAYDTNDIEVLVNASGYTGTESLKQQIRDLVDGNGAAIDWSNSAAVKQAVNAALASVTTANVESYIKAAQARARSDHRAASTAVTAYDSGAAVWLVPYLEVNVTEYRASSTNASLTATLTMKWRVEVHPADGSNDLKVKKATNVANDAGTYIAKAGAPLTLADNLGTGVEITFKSGVSGATYAHQADTYDYAITSQKFTVTHAVNGNLGRFVLNSTTPLIRVGDKTAQNEIDAGAGKVVSYFSTLQAAVDAATDGQLVEINSAYKGSTTINMTGKARTIYIQANGSNVVVANASGGLVEENSKGSFYTIKLNRDNTVIANASISVGSAGNGTASVNTTVAKPGNTVSGTYTANSGYKAGTFTATAQPGNKSVTVSVSANGTFSFTVPSDATSVTVTPSFVLDTGLPFTDVYATDWYFDGVKYCYNTTNNGYRLMTGLSDTKFGSDRPYERAQVVQILWNMKGRPEPKTTVNPYTDISSIHYAYKAVLWATENNYAEGYPDGTFRPGQSVTREEMVVFLWRAAGKPAGYNSISLNGYTDGWNVHDWGLSAVKWAVALNILSGQNSVSLNGTLAARSTAYRREVAVTVMQFDQKNLF